MNPPKKIIHFDQAATSFPKPPCVAERMMLYMTQIGCNVNRGCYADAYHAEDILFDTRQRLTELFHGDTCKNVILTANITTSLNILLKGLLSPGDHVLVSAMEHNAIMRPLRQLERTGLSFDRIPCDSCGNLLTEHLYGLLKKDTKAVVMTHASNVCGTVMPLEMVGDFCHANGLKFIVDSAQTAGILPIDMQQMNIDALAFTGHKGLLGPQGTGGFLVREGLGELIDPLLSGGTGSISYSEDIPEFMPDRLEPGTPNLPGIYGLHAALGYLKKTGLEIIRKRELDLTARFLDGLSQIAGVCLIGRKDMTGRIGVVSIQISGMDLAEAATRLDRDFGIQTRVGLHCAPSAHHTLGTYPTGTLRFSFGHCNTAEEIDFCLDALERICHGVQTA